LREVSAGYQDKIVIDRLSMTLDLDAYTAVIGPVGAGKTTLLRALAGLEPRTSGTILLAGRPLAGVPPHKRSVGLVFQEPRLFPNLSVADNVTFALRIAGVGAAERERRAAQLLEEVGLSGLAGRATSGLSGGEAQRIALARALCASPALLLLDEPLGAVDPNRRRELRALIERVQRERGVTTLLVTHDRGEAAELGETLALMIDGRVIQHDEPSALFERPASAVVARFFGMSNVIRGSVASGRMRIGDASIEAPGSDGPAVLAIRPEHVVVGAGELRMDVAEAAYLGTHVRLRLVQGALALEAQVPPAGAPPAGARVAVELPRERLWRFPESGAAADRSAARR